MANIESGGAVVIQSDLAQIKNGLIVFEWGGGNREVISAKVALSRLKARIADCRIMQKDLETSKCFHRACAYYQGIVQNTGKELKVPDLKLKNKISIEIFKKIKTVANE